MRPREDNLARTPAWASLGRMTSLMDVTMAGRPADLTFRRDQVFRHVLVPQH